MKHRINIRAYLTKSSRNTTFKQHPAKTPIMANVALLILWLVFDRSQLYYGLNWLVCEFFDLGFCSLKKLFSPRHLIIFARLESLYGLDWNDDWPNLHLGNLILYAMFNSVFAEKENSINNSR